MINEEQEDLTINFTDNAENALYSTVDHEYFLDRDADLIYQALSERLQYISFGDYLKRYIYQAAGIRSAFSEVPPEEYQRIIRDAFEDNNTPLSFEPTSTKPGAIIKSWLTQQSVNRRVVFLLGFGLAMTTEDVNDFLKKALHEHGINFKDPFEVICWYCYENGFGFPKFDQLWSAYRSIPADRLPSLWTEGTSYTMKAATAARKIGSEEELMNLLSQMTERDDILGRSATSLNRFRQLYDDARTLIADIRNGENERDLNLGFDGKSIPRDKYTRDDIGPGDLEEVLYSGIGTDRHGNLISSRKSNLHSQFAGKRCSRQRLNQILSGRADVDRFDLITLNFFICSQKSILEADSRAKYERYSGFIDSTNKILDECGFGPLYMANPYECFLSMCILSVDPLGTYTEVWEDSYSREN